ncbi:S-protein homolog 3 [Linum grandiflorum]
MAATTTACTILLILTMASAQIIRTADVTITNWLTGRLYLNLQCKSKQDDLGEKVVPKWRSYSWHFTPNFWGTTQFFCAFSWDGSEGVRWFDMYVQKRDQDRCSDCKWVVTQRGPCWYNSTANSYNVCYDWNQN